MYTT